MKKFSWVWKLVTLVAGALLCLGLCSCTEKISYTIEAGKKLPEPIDLIYADGITYDPDVDPTCTSRPGKYTLNLTDGAGKKYQLILTVKDRTKPKVVSRHVYYALGTTNPDAADFIGSIEEVDTYEAYFTCDLPDFTEIGDYPVTFRVKDASGNESRECASILTVIRDTQAPVFETIPELSAFIGEAIAYRKGLVVTDNCGGSTQNGLTVEVDSSQVNPNVAGDYPVIFTATDASGNKATAQAVIHIYDNQITQEMLMEKVADLMARITTEGMTVEEKLRAAHAYIQKNISYTADSDKSDWVRAAYDGLFGSMAGDCFNYFAAAKAVLIHLGLDYREFERTPGVAEGTHFWLMVNIGTSSAPRWYHYDATRLLNSYDADGCLITDKQLFAYNKYIKQTFYAYNQSAYPPSATEIISPSPKLEPYY